MILKNLEIEFQTYGENKGKYEGRARFDGELGTVIIRITPEAAQKILAICADAIVVVSKNVAQNLVAQVINHPTPALSDAT